LQDSLKPANIFIGKMEDKFRLLPDLFAA